MLGALIGEPDESDMGLDHTVDGEASEEEIEIAGEASVSGSDEAGFDDSDELEITLEPDETGDEEMIESLDEPLIAADAEGPIAEVADSLDDSLSDFEFESSADDAAGSETTEGQAESNETKPDASAAAESEGLTLDFDEGEAAESLEANPEESEELSIDLGEISVDESPTADDGHDTAPEPVASAVTPEAQPTAQVEAAPATLEGQPAAQDEAAPVNDEAAARGPERDETVLSLDELKINDTGELEINTDFNTTTEAKEAAPDQQEPPSPQVAAAAPGDGASEDVVELEDLTLDELTFDQSEVSEAKAEEPASDPGVETIDFEELPLDGAVFGDSSNSTIEEGTIDLENLDLELDLGELERK